VDIFIPVPEGVMSVEVAAPHHMVILATPGVVRVILEEAAEDRFGSRVSAWVIDIEYS